MVRNLIFLIINEYFKRVWQSVLEGNKVRFSYISADGEEGYPGTLTAVVTYELTNANEVIIDYQATCDESTPVNLTNHSYFNLEGEGASNIFDHEFKIEADQYLARAEDGLVTGEIRDVNGTAFDFRNGCANLTERIKQASPVGFDHCFCVPNWDGSMKHVARYINKNKRYLSVAHLVPQMEH